MSALKENSLTSMKAAFPTAPTPIHGIPTLASLIYLMMHMCCCLQTQKTPASATMNMLFLAASPDLYLYFTNETYPSSYFPFPKEVDDVPDFSTCPSNNECKSLKATHAHDQKTQADIVTMNAALSNVFLANLPKVIHETYKPIHIKQLNTVFLHMFDWFITKYGRTTTEDREENQQRMAATWHPSKGFKPLATRLFIGTSYASAARYPMDNCDVINIGLHIIKRCGMYAKEYKNWISHENVVPSIIKMIDSFKEYWANAIALVNQTAILVSQHGYRMTPMDDDTLVATYNDLLANFGTAFAAMQETIKNQADSLVAVQTQLVNIQLCMNVGQQPPSSSYAPAQQQRMFTNHNKSNGGGQGNGHGFPQQPTMNYGGTSGGQQNNICPPPNPYKRWENWNYCSSYGGDVDDNHTSATCGKPGPMHNPNATRANIMGGSVAGMHKTILPSTSGRTPPNHCTQQQQRPQQRPPNAYYPPGGTAWQQPTPLAQYGRMPLANGTYRQQVTMAMPVYQPGQGMMMNVGQHSQGTGIMLLMQMGQQPMAAPMLMNHYAPNQQPNQMLGYF
jgi:hypothetical protein